MPGISIDTRDPEEAGAACGDVYFPHRLTVLHERRRFRMSLRAAVLGPVAVGVLGYAGEVRIETGELETGYEVNVPLTGRLHTWTGADRVLADPDTAAVYRPDGATMLHGWSGGGGLVGLKIDRATLETELAHLLDAPVRGPVALASTLDVGHGPGRQWWALARSLLELLTTPDGPLTRPLVARPLAHAVIAGLLHTVDHPYRSLLAASPATPPPAAIRQAVDLLESEPETPFTAVDVARAVGLSVRSLQEGFARHVGVPPMTYLRQVRLRRAHADLVAADPARCGVAEVATRWGFTHLGRFAAAYRRRYGTSPSETLRRAD
ncbi:AraC family transcriptional regulator [Pseudonocardia acidicola]|uniref:AraC family transcriptional regulator n=1 Tax=Pseudonocardia acidicola TaxID=2724939 RepID=A0ABX1S5R3_9PSEU|nr:AraC family transcriptional regulator [Pseudonocardia acidicola]NMH95793.1 AraC family transcriptional regulator [Pseudonocardia acidicola]